MRTLPTIVAALATVMTLATPAFADTRFLPFTYQYATPGQGERELELFTDFDQRSGFENELEFEYGVTDHLALSAYAVARPYPFEARAFKLEGRYRLLEPGVLPVDVALYGEYEHMLTEPPNLEAKLILEKALGPVTLEANLIGEKQLGEDPAELNASAGAVYHASEMLHPGVELVYDANVLFAGPTLAVDLDAFKVTAGAYYSTSGALARLILEQEF